jgi:hypothetical protein
MTRDKKSRLAYYDSWYDRIAFIDLCKIRSILAALYRQDSTES